MRGSYILQNFGKLWFTNRVRVEVNLDPSAICRENAVIETSLHTGLLDRARNSDHGVASANVPAWIVASQRYRVAQYATMNLHFLTTACPLGGNLTYLN